MKRSTDLDVLLPFFLIDQSRVAKLSQICLAFHRTRDAYGFIYFLCKHRLRYGRMPSSLATVIGWIEKSIPNEHNQRLVHRFVEYMQGTETSEKYQRVNLIVIILFAKFLGPKARSQT